jgi:DNA-binding PadR family transcriptional regulator
MTRIFHRGELRKAIVAALAAIEPANGYSIMQALGEAIGESWRPSPGAIYPAILSLEDGGFILGTDDGTGSKDYRLTESGRRLHAEVSGTLATVADRARQVEPTHTLGSLIDDFGATFSGRSHRLDPVTASAISQILDDATHQIDQLLTRETNTDG